MICYMHAKPVAGAIAAVHLDTRDAMRSHQESAAMRIWHSFRSISVDNDTKKALFMTWFGRMAFRSTPRRCHDDCPLTLLIVSDLHLTARESRSFTRRPVLAHRFSSPMALRAY